MIKQENTYKKNTSFFKSDSLHIGQKQRLDQKSKLTFLQKQFTWWCKSISLSDLERHFKICFPQATAYLRDNFFQSRDILDQEISGLKSLSLDSRKVGVETYCKFGQAILLTSDRQYLDSITFHSQMFQFPTNIYNLLIKMKSISLLFNQNQYIKDQQPEQQEHGVKNPEMQVRNTKTIQFLNRISQKLQKNLSEKMKLNKARLLQKPETLINQFNYYWKICQKSIRTNIWYLGYRDIKKAVSNLAPQYKINLQKLYEFIEYAKEKSALQINSCIFSWKLDEPNFGIPSYMQLIFKQLKQRTRKNNKQYLKLKSRKQKKKKIRQRLPRRNSVDQSSNETNQTDIIYEAASDVNINQIVESKIQKDVSSIVDQINQLSNQCFENRKLGYQRLRHVLSLMGVQTKPYGSCCVGLATKNSDIDVAMDQSVLVQYCPYYTDMSSMVSAFFQYIEYQFINYPWISNLKIIPSAKIPIIKLTIDNKIEFNCPYRFGPEVHQFLNKEVPNKGPVQIDLTIQTTQYPHRHLGVISTIQTQKWLNEVPTLQAVAILIKKQLAERKLNQTYYGGINTYTLLVMIMAIIKRDKLAKQTRISTLLQKVLKFYGKQFKQDDFGIDLNDERIFYQKLNMKMEERNFDFEAKKRNLEVKDPQDINRIMTANCQFSNIKKVFNQLYQSYFIQTRKQIQSLCSAWNPKQNPFDQQTLMEWVQVQIEQKKIMGMYKN